MSNFQMAGTEGTFEYIVVANGTEGRVGFRPLGDESRVRVEPKAGASYGVVRHMDEELQGSDFEWKVPNGQFRFSTVVDNEYLRDAVETGLGVIGEVVEINPAAPAWARQLAGEPAPAFVPAPAAAPAASANEAVLAALSSMAQALAALTATLKK